MRIVRHYTICLILTLTYNATKANNRLGSAFLLDSLRSDTIITSTPLIFKTPKDSINSNDPIFDYIKSRQSKSRLNELLSSLIIIDRDTSKINKEPIEIEDYSDLTNKTINKIRLVRIDPFGTSINDTTKKAERWIDKTGNSLRFPTAQRIIKKNIILEEGTVLDVNEVWESERILRQLEFIADAKILVHTSDLDSSMVDIDVITRDRFPHAFSTGGSLSSPRLTLYTRNLTGHGVGFSHTSEFPSGERTGYRDRITVKNMERTRIDLEATYSNLFNEHSYMFKANRSFFISQLKYAGGFLYNRSFENIQYPFNPNISWELPLNYKFTNTWLGRSYLLESHNYFDHSHLYFTGQYVRSTFYDVPDSLSLHPALKNNKYYFGAITLAKRNYYQNSKIYNFDRTEDVPYGFMASLIFGFNEAPNNIRPYFRAHFSFGKAIVPDNGYLYGKIEAGTFINNGKGEQGEITFKGKYISRLSDAGIYQIRNFIELEYIKGFNRYYNEYLLLNEKSRGITGLTDQSIVGKEKLVLKTESVLFTPHRLAGFNMIFLGFADIGIIGDGKSSLFKQDYQASIGGAIRLINNKLVFRTIQIRMAWLPLLNNNEVPLNFRISGETPPRFDDFIPEAPRQDTFQ